MIKTSLKTSLPPPPKLETKISFRQCFHSRSIHPLSNNSSNIFYIALEYIVSQTILNKFPPPPRRGNRGINDVLSVVAPPPEFLFASLSESTRVTRQGDIVSRVIHSICVPHKSPRREKTEAKKKGLLVDIRSDQNIHFSRFNTACIRGRSLGIEGGM